MTRPSHVCVFLKSESFSRDGTLRYDAACPECGRITAVAIPVRPVQQLPLVAQRERRGK